MLMILIPSRSEIAGGEGLLVDVPIIRKEKSQIPPLPTLCPWQHACCTGIWRTRAAVKVPPNPQQHSVLGAPAGQSQTLTRFVVTDPLLPLDVWHWLEMQASGLFPEVTHSQASAGPGMGRGLWARFLPSVYPIKEEKRKQISHGVQARWENCF